MYEYKSRGDRTGSLFIFLKQMDVLFKAEVRVHIPETGGSRRELWYWLMYHRAGKYR